MKTCLSCKIEKPFSEFYKDKACPSGQKASCRQCLAQKAAINIQLRAARYETLWPRNCSVCEQPKGKDDFCLDMHHRKTIRCRVCLSARNKEYTLANKERLKSASRERYHKECPEQRKERRAVEYLANRGKILAARKEYHRKNGDKRRAYQKRYYNANKEAIAKYMLAYVKTRYANDRLFALSMNMRGRLNHVLSGNGWVKKRSNEATFGCTYEYLITYLESKFLPGMSWENRTKWHIDHEIPLASAKTPEDLISLCHHSNLQVLWAEDNLKKGAKMPPEVALRD